MENTKNTNKNVQQEEKKARNIFAKLERDTYKNQGEDRFRYFIPVVYKGQRFNAYMTPADIDGYQYLDSLYKISNNVDVYIEDGTFTDDNGVVHQIKNYYALVVDGPIELTCKLKAGGQTSKSILELAQQIKNVKDAQSHEQKK